MSNTRYPLYLIKLYSLKKEGKVEVLFCAFFTSALNGGKWISFTIYTRESNHDSQEPVQKLHLTRLYMTELCVILKWCSVIENNRPGRKSSLMKVLLKSEMSPSASRDVTHYAATQRRNSATICNRPVPIAAPRYQGLPKSQDGDSALVGCTKFHIYICRPSLLAS